MESKSMEVKFRVADIATATKRDDLGQLITTIKVEVISNPHDLGVLAHLQKEGNVEINLRSLQAIMPGFDVDEATGEIFRNK